MLGYRPGYLRTSKLKSPMVKWRLSVNVGSAGVCLLPRPHAGRRLYLHRHLSASYHPTTQYKRFHLQRSCTEYKRIHNILF
ncbi:hypothetical protein E2C01_067353 [Portunus trituberculatus]|uniref:Uncharacterized protein n=1 Tax=Portunus trituberculatus TaxID=210409 RepID=A0A5B7HWH2_PORTR|nr:hypothetical protein [Portunus trituberculatus]